MYTQWSFPQYNRLCTWAEERGVLTEVHVARGGEVPGSAWGDDKALPTTNFTQVTSPLWAPVSLALKMEAKPHSGMVRMGGPPPSQW